MTVLLFVSGFPAPAGAYPVSVTGFVDGATGGTVSLAYNPRAALVGTVGILSNATVASASVGLSGSTLNLTDAFTDNASSGFAAGALGAGLRLSASGLSLALVNGSTEFSGSGLDLGSFAGTTRTASGVVLTGASGTYDSPSIAWNGVSYGRLVANFVAPPGSTITFSVVDSNGTTLQGSVAPGGLVTVNGSLYPSVRIRAALSAPSVAASPGLTLVGAGYVLADYYAGGAQGETMANLHRFGDSLEIRESPMNWTEANGNPYVTGVGGTWYSMGPLPGTTVNVGGEVWHYFSSADSTGSNWIGRMVSTNGGSSWTVDASPMLGQTAASWDSGYVGIPSVWRETNGSFKMWYMGAVTPDAFDIGLATSTDGISWTKYASNPVFVDSVSGFDSQNVGWPSVWKQGSTYSMFYGGRTTTDARKSIGLATSTDGISWTRYASNPIIAYGSTTYGSYDIGPGEIAYIDGVWYLYWTCGSGVSAYDTCVSYSTDAVTWTHNSVNPVITHGDGAWDSVTAELATRVVDPATERSLLLFTGRPGSASYGMGKATAKRESGGSVTAYWDLAGEVPKAFLSHAALSSVPGSTTLQATIATSASNGSYGGPESVGLSDTSVILAPSGWLRHTLTFSTSDPAATPAVTGTRLAYERYAPSGTFVSAAVAEPYPILNATITLNGSVPTGAALGIEVSNDGGATWQAAVAGQLATFPSAGTSLRYRLTFSGTSNRTATLGSLGVSLGVASRANDAVLRGADGSLVASLAGELVAPVAITLDPAYFNTRIAPFAALDPAAPVYFDLYANASSAGVVKVDWVAFNLTFADKLVTYFAPEGDTVTLEEGEAQSFRVTASTEPGVSLGYEWWLDGVRVPSALNWLIFAALPGSLGTHTLSVNATNGQFTQGHVWTLTVVPKLVYMAVKFYPAALRVDVPAGLFAQFYAGVSNASGTGATFAWTLDGAPAGSAALFNYTAPEDAGLHTLAVVVTDGVTTQGWSWEVNVTAVPGAVTRQLAATFAPAGDLVVALNAAQSFSAALAAPAPTDVTFEWRLDGAPVGSDQSSYTFTASAAGRFVVSVLASNATALAVHSWVVTVPAPAPPPPPAPPTVTVSGPAEGTSTADGTATVTGTATPGSNLTVNGVRVTLASDGTFSAVVALDRGSNLITVTARDGQGQVGRQTVNVTYAPSAPPINTTSPTQAADATPYLIAVGAMAAVAGVLGYMLSRERAKGKKEAEEEAGVGKAP